MFLTDRINFLVVLVCLMFSTNLSHANDLNQTPVDSNVIGEKKAELYDLSKSLDITVGSGMYMPGMHIYNGPNETTRQSRSTRDARLGYYVYYEKTEGDNLRLVKISESRPTVTDFTKQEVLYFSADLKFVEPDYRSFIPVKDKNEMLCWTGAGRNRGNNAMLDYNPCESSLTNKSSINLGNAAFMAVFTLGLSAVAGTTNRNVFVDKDKVISLIKETSTMDALREQIAANESANKLQAYRSAFRNAKTSAQIDTAIRQYSNSDLEALIPTALIRREQMLREEINKENAEKVAAAAEKARGTAEEARKEKKREQIASFQKSIVDGSETNCGPVIEVKAKLVKVAFPIANYGNEHWIRRDEIFPAGYGCSFVNGQYQRISAY